MSVIMAFYLKKTKLKGRTYLSIDESFYSHEKKGTAHKCYKSLGSVETWMQKGLTDPVSHFQKEVDALNQEKASEGIRKISDASPILYLGYFPLKSILEKMHTKKYVDYFKNNIYFLFTILYNFHFICSQSFLYLISIIQKKDSVYQRKHSKQRIK